MYRSHHLRAFTMIELLLAVALSALLLLMAFVTFRAVTRSMQDIDQLTRENRLIRAGYLAVLDDADHWRSQADPAYPFLRRLQSDDLPSDNSLYDVRPFREVVWPMSLDAAGNPNWNQAHDPRSWYRGTWLPNVSSGMTVLDEMNHGRDIALVYIPDFSEEMSFREFRALTRNMDSKGNWNHFQSAATYGISHVVFPRGWNPWHVMGDYAALSHIDMPTDTATAKPPYDNSHLRDPTAYGRAAGSRPKQTWHLFQELGTRGCATYLPPGSPTLILAPSDQEVVASYRSGAADRSDEELEALHRMDHHFRKGEVPWMLNADANLVFNKKMGVLDGGLRGPEDRHSYPSTFTDSLRYPSRPADEYNRQNYAWAMPSLAANKSHYVAGPHLPFLYDFDQFSGWAHFYWANPNHIKAGNPKTSMGSAQEWRRSLGAIWFPPNPLRNDLGSDTFDWRRVFDVSVDPFDLYRVGNHVWGRRSGWNKRVIDPTSGEKVVDRSMHPDGFTGRMLAQHTRSTWLQPRNQTDDPRPDLRVDADLDSLLRVDVRRYVQFGYDKCDCRIRLQDPGSDRVISFGFSPITTSYRGARQYWGRQSLDGGVADGFGNRFQLGDSYAR